MTNQLVLGANAGVIACPAGSEQAYYRTISAIPVLDADEELRLTRAYYFQEDLEAARRLIISHLRFVVYIARSYQGYGLQLADLIQEGNIGLMKAVKRFNPDKGVRLVSYAVHWIRSEIHEFVIRNWRIVKVATTKSQRRLFFNLRKTRKSLSWLNGDEVESIAADLNVKPETVREMEMRLTSKDVGFDNNGDDTDEPTTDWAPARYLPDNRYNPQRVLEKECEGADKAEQLQDALATLDERSVQIIKRRWLDDDKATLQTLADELKLSAERVRQLEKAAMTKIRQAMEANVAA